MMGALDHIVYIKLPGPVFLKPSPEPSVGLMLPCILKLTYCSDNEHFACEKVFAAMLRHNLVVVQVFGSHKFR